MKECHIYMMLVKLLLWVSPWHDFLEICTKLFVIQTLLGLTVLSSARTTPWPRARFLWGEVLYQHWLHLLILHAFVSWELTLMKHPFPWSQPASPPSSLSTKAESEALSYDIAELIMLLYWFCEPLSHRGMCGGWVQHSQCTSSNSFQPSSFCFESGSFQPGLDFQRSNVPAHFVLNELALPWSPHWTASVQPEW